MLTGPTNLTDKSLQVALVDNWHARWREVVDAIDFLGQRESLHIDADGWLSARHNLLVAFAADDCVAGHLCFRVEPIDCERGQVEARLAALGVQPGFDRGEVEQMLRAAARKRASALKCRNLVGFGN